MYQIQRHKENKAQYNTNIIITLLYLSSYIEFI